MAVGRETVSILQGWGPWEVPEDSPATMGSYMLSWSLWTHIQPSSTFCRQTHRHTVIQRRKERPPCNCFWITLYDLTYMNYSGAVNKAWHPHIFVSTLLFK